jgi:RNA polymerase sigma-70 factor, ECF subfamily
LESDDKTWQIREIADQTKDVEEQYVTREGVERLRRAICRLNPQLRAVVEIQQSEDGQVKEIAELAGISISAAKSRLSRARTVLRRALI